MKKTRKSTKKGFTLVELVVVIAIVAILGAVSVVGYFAFIEKAKDANDQTLVTQLNTVLKAEEPLTGKPTTMHEVLTQVEDNGYVVEKLTPTNAKNDILWDSKNNSFVILNKDKQVVYPEGAKVETNNQLWQIVEEYDASLPFSQYLKDVDYTNTTFDVKTGIDLGENKEVFNITYNGDLTEDIIIRTNGSESNLTVNTNNSNVKHYGNVGKVNIEHVPTDCYYENGHSSYIVMNEGKLVLEDNSKVGVLNVKNETVLIEKKNAVIENAYCATEAVKNAVTNVELTVEADDTIIEKKAEEIKDNSLAEENNGDVLITNANGDRTYLTFENFRNSVNSGHSYEGEQIKLLRDVDLSAFEIWEPIGNRNNRFKGVFDGNNKTVKNVNLKGATEFGLFGVTTGVTNPNFDGDSSNWNKVWDESTLTFSTENIKESYYTCVIKNLNITKATSTAYRAGGFHWDDRKASILVGYAFNTYISNVHISESTLNCHVWSGAVAGCTYRCVLDNVSTANDVVVNGNLQENSGNIGGLIGASQRTVIMNCTNNATINTTGWGNTGGIVGFQVLTTGSPEVECAGECVFYNNVNNGKINATGVAYYTGGIVGGFDCNTLLVKNTNNGLLTIEAVGAEPTRCCGGIIGGSDYGVYLYSNINNGNIKGNAENNGGIAGFLLSSAVKGEGENININNGKFIDSENIEQPLNDYGR